MMSNTAPTSHAFRVAQLSQNGQTAFEINPDSAECAAISEELGLIGLRKLRFVGHIRAHGDTDWQLNGVLGATVVQPCSVTLAPVTSRIDCPVERLFVQAFVHPDEEEVEMPEDERVEPLGAWIDPSQVMIEALSLAMPDYPRAQDAELGAAQFSAADVKPMTDEDARPFAGLAGLKDQLKPKD